MKLEGDRLQVILVKADGERSLISSQNTNFRFGSYDKINVNFKISDALVLDRLPDLEGNFPTKQNLKHFSNGRKLLNANEFPELNDTRLHLMFEIKETELMHYTHV